VPAKLCQLAQPKAEQDALLDPRIHPPACRRGGIRLRRPQHACFQPIAQAQESVHRSSVANSGRASGKVVFDLGLQLRGHASQSGQLLKDCKRGVSPATHGPCANA
jgi:hypothetical protein